MCGPQGPVPWPGLPIPAAAGRSLLGRGPWQGHLRFLFPGQPPGGGRWRRGAGLPEEGSLKKSARSQKLGERKPALKMSGCLTNKHCYLGSRAQRPVQGEPQIARGGGQCLPRAFGGSVPVAVTPRFQVTPLPVPVFTALRARSTMPDTKQHQQAW